jgi:hypothetical protein
MTDAETRAERVAAWRASGLSAVKFCEGQDFTAPRLWRWAAKLRRVGQEIGTQGSDQAKTNRVRLARVVRVPVSGNARPGGGSLTVELYGVRVVVPIGFDRVTLAAVLDEIEARGGARTSSG